MSFLTLWFVVFILERSTASKHRSVNLALETVLQFDKADDINVINNVQNFLSHLQVLLNRKHGRDNAEARRNDKYKFTDFVEDLLTTFKSFEDNDLKEVYRIVHKDFRTRQIDNDLIDDNAKRFLSGKLAEIRKQPATKIREDLDKILRKLQSDGNKQSSFVKDFVNNFYKRDSERKLSKIIKRLNIFRKSGRKSKVVLKSIIDKVVNDVIYEHYNNLEEHEKGYIKKFVNAYLKDDITRPKTLKIKQRPKITEITQGINTNQRTDKSKTWQQVTAIELTPETFRDVSEETTKKLLTHITLYPKTVKEKKMLKFRTGIPKLHGKENKPLDKETTKDKREEEETKETHEIFTNQSVEINVNLKLKHSRDSEDQKDSQMIESFRAQSTTNTINKGFLKAFQRALEKKSRKKKKYTKSSSRFSQLTIPSSTHDLSTESFGSLYQVKTPKKYDTKKVAKLDTYKGKSIIKDRYIKSTYVDDIVKSTSLREEINIVGDHRRVNKPLSLNEDKFITSDLREILGIVTTTTEHTFTTQAVKTLIVSTAKLTKPVTHKPTTITTESEDVNEIFDKENLTEITTYNVKVTKHTPLLESITTNKLFKTKENTTILNEHNNKTTVSPVSVINFDLNNYIKKSDILNFKDVERNKQIEEKMKADLGMLLDTPTNATTDGFTDVFKELEDAFQI